MPWENSFDEEDEFVFTRVHGVVTLLDYQGCARGTYEFSKKHKSKRLLVSLLEVSSVLTLSDLANIPPIYIELGFDQTFRAAFCVVGDKSRRETYSFFEKMCLDKGLDVRIFNDEEDARIWLSCG